MSVHSFALPWKAVNSGLLNHDVRDVALGISTHLVFEEFTSQCDLVGPANSSVSEDKRPVSFILMTACQT